jgi:hypothetical protein
MTIIKMLNRNKKNAKKEIKCKKIKGRDNRRDKITEGTKFRRDFSEGTEKEGEEKNSSSTQAK